MSFAHIFLRPAMINIVFLICLTEVLMNTKTETSDLKWTIFSHAKPEVCNPGLTLFSVFLTDLVVTGDFWLSAVPLLLCL